MLKLNVTLKRMAAAIIGIAILTTSISTVSYADPPRWKKAHGHHQTHHKKHFRHKKHQNRSKVVYVERRDYRYRDDDYGQNGGLNASQGGTILGAILGAVAGTQIGKGKGRVVAIVGGAVLGGVLGGEIGRSMQQSDQAQVQQVFESNRTGQASTWQNPDTGSQYKLPPTRTYKTSTNQDCRDFKTWAVIDGYEEEIQGTACRRSDGTWQQLKI